MKRNLIRILNILYTNGYKSNNFYKEKKVKQNKAIFYNQNFRSISRKFSFLLIYDILDILYKINKHSNIPLFQKKKDFIEEIVKIHTYVYHE